MNGTKSFIFCTALLGLFLVTYGAPGGKVIGGSDAQPGQFPYMVSIQIFGIHNCGGSILTKRSILTAAHCLRSIFNYRVYVGSSDLKGNGSYFNIESFETHPNFSSSRLHHDIAVAYLSEDLEFSNFVQPIELDSEYVEGGYDVTASGWGYYTNSQDLPNILQYIDLKTIDFDQCLEETDGVWPGFTPHYSHMCTFTKTGEGICNGDSGSALVRDGKQVGVVSWSVAQCAKGVPDGYARVSTEYEWIKSVTK